MKHLLITMLLLVTMVCITHAFAQGTSEKTIFSIPASKAYVEPWTGDRNPSVNPNAANMETSLVWYPVVLPGKYELFLEFANLPENLKTLTIRISSPEDETVVVTEKEIAIEQPGRIALGSLDVKNKAYYRVEVKPMQRMGRRNATPATLVFEAAKGTDANVFATQYQTSPSVHLWLSPDDKKTRQYDWLYGEILVPEGFDPMYTYYMSIGFVRGYFGIQVNSATERRVLFSIWDSSNEAIDRNKVKPEDRVMLIDKGNDVYGGGFGNEGTGGQTYWRYPWKTGEKVRFIMNVRHLPNDFVLYSAWFKDVEKEGWKYMATWQAPREKRYLDGFYSFIENFGQANGQEVRKAYYLNYWGKEVGGDWVEMNRTRVTHTDGKPDGRRDYEGGKALDGSNRFYMQSGGYTAPKDQKEAVIELENKRPDVDLDALNARIDLGLENAKKRKPE